jgi:hypothetical protein
MKLKTNKKQNKKQKKQKNKQKQKLIISPSTLPMLCE